VAHSRELINRVQQATDIVDVVAEHVSLTRKGREMVGLCPFHDDHRPSLYVNPAKQIFKCFACGAGGSVFTFVQMRENLTFGQAVERLAKRAGIRLEPQHRRRQASGQADPNALAEVNAWAAAVFHRNLLNSGDGKKALDYLAGRGISNESIRKWRLGLALKSHTHLVDAAGRRNIGRRLLAQAGLVTGGNGGAVDRFVNRLVFPITDVTGRIIGFGARSLDGGGAKYINSPATVLFDKSSALYGLDLARHQIVASGTAIVVEGYTDAIMAHQHGFGNVVATLGTSFTQQHGRLLRRYAKQIVLVFDSDRAGIEAANRALQICLAEPIGIKIVSIPQAKDPCEFLVDSGPEAFGRLVESGTDVFQFKWDRLSRSLSGDNSMVDRRAALNEYLDAVAAGLLAGRLPYVERGLVVNQLSNVIGLEPRQINAELQRRVRRAQQGGPKRGRGNGAVKDGGLPDFYTAAQREILEVLLNEPGLYGDIRRQVGVSSFEEPMLRQIAEHVLAVIEEGTEEVVAAVLGRTESTEAAATVVELTETGRRKGNYRRRLAGAIDAVERYRKEKAKSRIKAIKDQERFLKELTEHTGRENPYNVGMV